VSPSRLRPVIQSLALVKPGDEDSLVAGIQQNMQVEPVITTMSTAVATSPTAKKKPSASNEPVPGFNVRYTDSNASAPRKFAMP